jgi:hypothetical protein
MSGFAKHVVEWSAKRQSRRGFMATCGKVVLGLGLAMVGVRGETKRAWAASCCPGPSCTGTWTWPCPNTPPPYCPNGCYPIGAPTQCCDTSTGRLHDCYTCHCGTSYTCQCEFVTNDPC